MHGGEVHASYWRCTLPCYHCQVPLPDPLPPCSGHRYAHWAPDKGLRVKEQIGKQGGMGTYLWRSASGQVRASSSWLSGVLLSARNPGSAWKTNKIPVRALALGAKDAAHLIYTSRKRVAIAQWEPVEVWYATNRSGSWKHQRVTAASGYPSYFTPASIALALDGDRPVVAINGAAWSGRKSSPGVSQPLVAATLRDGTWRFVQVDTHSTGALDVAACSGRIYVAYFGEADFRLAEVDIF